MRGRKNRNNKPRGLLAILVFGGLTAPWAAAAPEGQRDEALLTLVELMETDIATRTDLQDPDKAPGLVTVLSGERLRARGYQTVRHALNHQAGFDITLDSRGITTPAVRGIGGIRSGASGKVKLMVNGASMNVVRAGVVEDAMEIPVNLVDRVEIIRGPGSAVHGEFAYAAVVNVVTRRDDSEVALYHGADGNQGVDGLFNYSGENGLTLDILGSVREIDPDVQTGTDALYRIGQGDVSLAPGKSNEHQQHRFVNATLGYRDTELKFYLSDNEYGDYFGLNASLAPEGDDARRDNRVWFLEANQLFNLGEYTELRIKGGYQNFNGDFRNITIQPPGYSLFIPPIPAFNFPGMTVVYEDGILAETFYEEERYNLGADLTLRGWDRHTLLLGVAYSHVEDTESYGAINLDIDNPNPLFAALPLPEIEQYPGASATIAEGEAREITRVYLQDDYRPGERLTLPAGARFDSYSDVKDTTNPRLAAVSQLNDKHIHKAQYGAAFRPPTYAELFSAATTSLGNPEIEPETIDTFELGWIYKTSDLVLRATAFHSDLDNLIVLSPSGFGTQQFSNTGGATSRGLELAGKINLGRAFRIDGNLTWLDTEDDMTGADLEGIADLMTNINLVYQPRTDLSVNLAYRFVGERHRAPGDPRDDMDETQTLDLNLNLFNIMGAGVTLRAGVFNLFDEDVVFPAPPNTYVNDFPRPGRTWLLELSKTFK